MRAYATHLVTSRPRASRLELDDATLIARARQGDAAAFETLAQRHVRTLLGLLRATLRDDHAAEDAAQEALLSAYRGLKQLDDPAKFAAWLYRIALREAARAERRKGPGTTPSTNEAAAPFDARLDERRAAVRAAVAELEEPYRLAVTLRYLEGLNAAEIAERLGVAHGTVRAQLSRAREMLEAKLRRHLP